MGIFSVGRAFPILRGLKLRDWSAMAFPSALTACSLSMQTIPILGNIAKLALLSVVFATALGCAPVRRFLSVPFLYVAGGMCYSAYLIHCRLLSAFSKLWSTLSVPGGFELFLVVAVSTVLLVSTAYYPMVERPFIVPRTAPHTV